MSTSPDIGTVPSPVTESELLERAAWLAGRIAPRREQALEFRRIPDESISDIVDSGILRASMPARYGGYELPFGAHTSAAMTVAAACGATGWVAGIFGSHNWWLGKFPAEAQHDVWANDPDALVAATFALAGAGAKRKGDDFVLTGRWHYCSGVDAAGWVVLNAPVEGESGGPRMFLLPREDFEIEDVWNAPGMRGTGSNDVIVDGATIPAHRAVPMAAMNQRVAPGADVNPGPTYRLPTMDVFAWSVAAPVIGVARGVVDAYRRVTSERTVLATGARVAQSETAQMRLSEASAEVYSAELIYQDNIRRLRQVAEHDRDLDAGEIARIKRDCAYACRLCRAAGARMAEALGAGGLTDTHPVHVGYLDILGGSSHRALVWDTNGPPYGDWLFESA